MIIYMNSTPSSAQLQNVIGECVSGVCVCKLGYYGSQCEHKCDVRSTRVRPNNAKFCDTVSSACQCHPGWYGCRCNITCPEPFYGNGCEAINTCEQENIVSYEKTNGNCNCKPGWRGSKCKNPCPDWNYGDDCKQECNCIRNKTRFCKMSGECICKDGFEGACNISRQDGTHSLVTTYTPEGNAECDHESECFKQSGKFTKSYELGLTIFIDSYFYKDFIILEFLLK
ncbi:platelet endothelial aggregation receptor 1-like [Anneissia japonica]|uniref:platelet endothelial aggregation receptor 1-like n=1 Tax=Anneissia japonica TaxID=1529436 RepID=UPI001425587E|nr:platelet endothelial aggregation receptor 1-like [Anneissia japonica]